MISIRKTHAMMALIALAGSAWCITLFVHSGVKDIFAAVLGAGWGVAARFEVSGPGRFDHARRWFRRWLAMHNVDDRVGLPGSGPVAFGSFTFDHGPGRSVFVIPQVLIAKRGGAAWGGAVSRRGAGAASGSGAAGGGHARTRSPSPGGSR